MKQVRTEIAHTHCIAEHTHLVRLPCPAIAKEILPGQFVMVKLPGDDPLLGRAFALFDTDGETLDIAFHVVGKMTAELAKAQAGQAVEVWGPLGKPFPLEFDSDEVNLAAGGIGVTPFGAYTRYLRGHKFGNRKIKRKVKAVRLFYGVRNSKMLIRDLDDFGAEVHIATEDGSTGFKGYVTQLMDKAGIKGPVVACGPVPMLKAVAELAAKRNWECHVSLETPMACGFGACFSCVTKVKTDDGWDYKRTCVDGPTFNANSLVWD